MDEIRVTQVQPDPDQRAPMLGREASLSGEDGFPVEGGDLLHDLRGAGDVPDGPSNLDACC